MKKRSASAALTDIMISPLNGIKTPKQSYGCILCPQDKVLSYAATNREGDREYKSNICQSCLARKRRIQNQQHTKTVTRPIRQEDPKRAQDVRHSPVGKATCARPAFADH